MSDSRRSRLLGTFTNGLLRENPLLGHLSSVISHLPLLAPRTPVPHGHDVSRGPGVTGDRYAKSSYGS